MSDRDDPPCRGRGGKVSRWTSAEVLDPAELRALRREVGPFLPWIEGHLIKWDTPDSGVGGRVLTPEDAQRREAELRSVGIYPE
jgi:hypothetical protein